MFTRIGFKVAMAISITVVASVVAISAVSVWREASRYVETRTAEIVGIARVLASTSAEALSRNDQIAAQHTLRSIRDFAGVVHASLETPTGRIFADSGSAVVLERDIEASNQRDPFAVLLGRPLIVAVPVRHGSETIGSLILTSETRDVWPRIVASLTTLILASLVTVVIGFIAAAVMTRKMVAPLRTLRDAMISLRETQNFAMRVPPTSADEIGELTETFNDLLTQIRKRDQALDAHRASLEDTVEKRTAALTEAKNDAERANRAKSTFLATMSHEIRTPMNGMLALTEMLADSPLPDREKRYATVVNKSGAALLSIINDILDFSKIESGGLTLEHVPASPRSILTDVLDIFHDRAREKGIALAGHVTRNVPETVVGDPVRLRQIISNLVGNAIKFTQAGHVRVAIDWQPLNGGLRIAVADTGIGISADKLETVFQSFSQADQTVTRRFGGTGLGLSICKQIAEAMKGTITVESEEGRGSAFMVALPLDEHQPAPDWLRHSPFGDRSVTAIVAVEDAMLDWSLRRHLSDIGVAIAAEDSAVSEFRIRFTDNPNEITGDGGEHLILVDIADAPGNVGSGQFRAVQVVPFDHARLIETVRRAIGVSDPDQVAGGVRRSLPQWPDRRVLVADDGAINREVAREVLRRFGVQVSLVTGGQAAIDAVAARSFDLVLMDCNMPDVDGYEATRQIRAMDETRAHPVRIIAMTADVLVAEDDAWARDGFDGYLSKPFGLAQVEDLLATWCGPGQADHSVPEVDPAAQSQSQAIAQPVRQDDLVDDASVQALMAFDNDGGGSLFDRLLTLFEDHAPPLLDRIDSACDARDFVTLASATHALKSMAGNIGAAKLHSLCQIAETAAKNRLPDALAKGEELITTYHRSILVLRSRRSVLKAS